MPRDVQQLRVVLVCPLDVREERTVAHAVIAELNRTIAGERGCTVKLAHWKDDARPGINAAGRQGLINEEMDVRDADIVVGVFWKRFGTPTGDEGSGTAYEIKRAFAAWADTGRPEVMVYFCERAYFPSSEEESKQQQAVLRFRQDLPEEVLHWAYESVVQFEKALREHLTRVLQKLIPTGSRPGVDLVDAPDSIRSPGPKLEFRELDHSVPLLGRGTEVAWLEGLWKLAQNGSRQIAIVQGVGGIGKTRLAAELLARPKTNARVLYGLADSPGSYQPFAGALALHFRGLSDDDLRWVVGEHGSTLARVLPSLIERGIASSSPARERGTERERLFEALRFTVARLSSAWPTILLIDNCHMMDDDGVTMLQRLLSLDNARLLVLLLTRPYAGKPFEQAIPQIKKDYTVADRELEPLDGTDAHEMYRRGAGVAGTSELVRTAEGNPAMLLLLVRQGAAAAPGGLKPAREVVDGLDEAHRRMLDVACLGPRLMTSSLLARATGYDRPHAEELLLDLADTGLLAAEEPRISEEIVWRFAHDTYRDAVLEALPEVRRADLSQHLASALEELGYIDNGVLADLWAYAENRVKARTRALAAAGEASGASAHERAASYYEKALAQTADDDAADRCDLHLKIARSLWDSGRFRDARTWFRRAADLAREHGLSAQLVDAALGRAGRIGFEGPTGDSELVETLRNALEQLDDSDGYQRSRVLAALAHAITFSRAAPVSSGDGSRDSTDAVVEARALVADAQALARDQGSELLLAEVLCTTSWAMWATDNLAERRALADEAVRLTDGLAGADALQIESRLFRMTCCLESGQTELARTDVADIADLAQIGRSTYYLTISAMAEATLALMQGPELGEAKVDAAQVIAQREHNPALSRIYAVQIFYTRFLQGRLRELRTCSESLTAYDRTLVAWRGGLALIYAEIGRLADARREFEVLAARRFATVPRDMFWLITMDNLARVCLTLADIDRAEEIASLLRPHSDLWVVAGGAGAVHGPVGLNLGRLEALLGDRERAELLLRSAHKRALFASCLPAAAEAAIELADLLVTDPQGASLPEVATRLREAVHQVEVVNSSKLAERVLETLDLAIPISQGYDADVADVLIGLRERAAALADPEIDRVPRIRRPTRVIALGAQALVRKLAENMQSAERERRLSQTPIQRAVLMSMVRFYQPEVAHPFSGTVVLQLTKTDPDQAPIVWSLHVDRKRAQRLGTQPAEPDLLVQLSASDFVRLLIEDLNGVEGWFEGQIRVEGDPIVAGRLVEMFGGPAAIHGLIHGPAGEAVHT